MAVEELERNKDFLEARLLAQLQEIDAKRTELAQWEQTILANMANKDRSCQNSIGSTLETTIAWIQSSYIHEQTPVQELRVTDSESETDSDSKTVVEHMNAPLKVSEDG